MKRFLPALLLLLLACAGDAAAFDEPTAKARLAEECVTCAAYYDVIANCVEATRPLDKDLASRYRSISQKLARESEELRGSPDTGQVLDAEAAMAREIRQDCASLAVLKDRHKEICKTIVEKRTARLNYWLDKQ